MVDHPDVIVVGAGIAGLAAAERLAAAGRRVLVLEGRPRAGGRIDTRQLPGWPLLEAGAEFVHGIPPALERLRRRARARRVELEQRHFRSDGRRLSRAEGAFEQTMALMEQLPREPPDRSYAALARERWWRRLARPEVHQLARAFVEGFNAAPAEGIGVIGLSRQSEAASAIEGERLFHIAGGYGVLVQALLRALDRAGGELRLGATVERVSWRPGQVQVRARGPLGMRLQVAAPRAVIALPLGVLKARPPAPAAVRFSPALPASKRAAIARLGSGPVLRVALRFAAHAPGFARRPFTFVHVERGAFPTFWRVDDGQQSDPTMIAWAAGPAATRLARSSEQARIETAVAALARGLLVRTGALAAALQGAQVFDWQQDPYSRGAYSYAPPGGWALPDQLGAPVGDTLYFAGEATHREGAMGTVHGALETGLEAARAVLAS